MQATYRKRLFIYIMIGIVFGIADWHYLDWLAHVPWGAMGSQPWMVPVVIALNYGIWLAPVLPIAVFDGRASRSAKNSALAAAACWTGAILSYYLYYTALLAFGRLPHMEGLTLFQEWSPGFWEAWSGAFQRIILNQVIEWLPVSVLGGAFLGFCTGWIWTKTKKVR